MDKKIAGLLGAVAGLATVGGAQAAVNPASAPDPAEAMQASTYADLLAPIPNAEALLEADNAARTQHNIEMAQYYYNYPPPPYYYHHDHHHHHHHSYYNPYGYNNHDHHHHHNSAFIGIPGVGGVVVGR